MQRLLCRTMSLFTKFSQKFSSNSLWTLEVDFSEANLKMTKFSSTFPHSLSFFPKESCPFFTCISAIAFLSASVIEERPDVYAGLRGSWRAVLSAVSGNFSQLTGQVRFIVYSHADRFKFGTVVWSGRMESWRVRRGNVSRDRGGLAAEGDAWRPRSASLGSFSAAPGKNEDRRASMDID